MKHDSDRLLCLSAEAVSHSDRHYTEALGQYQFLTPSPFLVSEDLPVIKANPSRIFGGAAQYHDRVAYHRTINWCFYPDLRP